MDFTLNETQTAIHEMVRKFSDGSVRPRADEIDKKKLYPADLVAQMGELGLMGMQIEDRYGGAGLDCVSYILAVEEISRGCASCGVIMAVNNSLVCDPIRRNGTEEQLAGALTALASGKALGCYGLSEPQSGSDAGNMLTVAKRDGDGWVINGRKNFITNGPESDWCVLFTTTDRDKKHKGILAFLIDTKTPGFGIGKIEDKLGISGSSCSELVIENLRVPDSARLGGVGDGFKIAMQTLDGGRISIAAQAIGIARAAYESAVSFASTRVAFGQEIWKFQSVGNKIADMATQIDAARLLTYRAASLKDQKKVHSTESAICKVFAAETAMRVATDAIQVHGGYGYTREYPAERHFRDAKITEIYEGTSEIQRMVIAQNIFKGAYRDLLA